MAKKKESVKKHRCYISIPITGVPVDQLHADRDAAVGHITSLGWQYFDPVAADESPQNARMDYRSLIMRDLAELHQCDRIWLCPGWERSLGCLIEITAFLAAWRDAQQRRVVPGDEPISAGAQAMSLSTAPPHAWPHRAVVIAPGAAGSGRHAGTGATPLAHIQIFAIQCAVEAAWASFVERAHDGERADEAKKRYMGTTPGTAPGGLFDGAAAPEKRRY